MTAEDLDALAADVGSKRGHDGCDLECSGRKLVELARGYLSLRLVQADHERQIAALYEWRRNAERFDIERVQRIFALQTEIAAVREGYRCLQAEFVDRAKQIAALEHAFNDVQKAYLRVCGEKPRDEPVCAGPFVSAFDCPVHRPREVKNDYLARHCMCVWPNTDPRCDIHRDGIGAPAGVYSPERTGT